MKEYSLTGLKITRVGLDQASSLAQISASTFEDTFKGTCSDEDMKEFLRRHFNLAQVEAELKDGSDYFYFAMVEDQPAGYVRFKEDYSEFQMIKNWKSLELKRLYVDKKFHGTGVAHSLMKFVLSYALQHEYQVVWLGVWEHNIRAQKFYSKYGFTSSGHSHNFPIGNTPQTDLWWWKFLDKTGE